MSGPTDAAGLPAPRISVIGRWWRIVPGGGEAMPWLPEPSDGRWQRGETVRALYLADTEETAWAEWFRHTAELGVPPDRRLPRRTWQLRVRVSGVADLTAPGVLEAHSLATMRPTRRQWPATQPVGEAYWAAGARGLLVPSAARDGQRVLVVFRPGPAIRGVTPIGPPTDHERIPYVPTGLRT